MSNNNRFTTNQHGFITSKSCITKLLEHMEDITQVIDNLTMMMMMMVVV